MSRRPYFTPTRSGGVGDGIGDKNAVQPTGTVFKKAPETVWVDVGNGVQLANLDNYLGAVAAGVIGKTPQSGHGPSAGGTVTQTTKPGAQGKSPTTVGPGVVQTGKPKGGTSGPGTLVVTTAKPKGDKNPHGSKPHIGAGPGNPFAGPAPLTPGKKDKATGGYAGFEIHPNPWFSNVEDFWESRYGEPGEWIGGIINVGADLVYNTPGAIDAAGINPQTPLIGAESFEQIYRDNVTAPDKQEPVDWGW